ncbi:MAG: DUF4262 domain-containing protein [Marinibacterium sp.]|nr:DUF4262 domain-containing protein [Marinibacterium sp.]
METDPREEKALADIQEHGCHVLYIFDENGVEPDFTYSIGIEPTSKQPELIVTGLRIELAHWIINEYNARVRAGETFAPGERYSGFLEKADVSYKVMSKKHYDEYLGWRIWLYRGYNFRAYQLIWPTVSGLWPTD